MWPLRWCVRVLWYFVRFSWEYLEIVGAACHFLFISINVMFAILFEQIRRRQRSCKKGDLWGRVWGMEDWGCSVFWIFLRRKRDVWNVDKSNKAFLVLLSYTVAFQFFYFIKNNVPIGMFPCLIFEPHSLRLLLRILVEISMGMSLNLFCPFFDYFSYDFS